MSKVSFESIHMNGHGVPEINCEDLLAHQSSVKIVDVRRPDEFTGELGHIQNAKLSTLETNFAKDLVTWPQNEIYVFVCRSGARSSQATAYAMTLGFKNVFNLEGGMIAWNEKSLPTI